MTDDDRARLAAIGETTDDGERSRLMTDYWRDSDRADRTPRGFAYLHLGMLAGTVDRLIATRRASVTCPLCDWSARNEIEHDADAIARVERYLQIAFVDHLRRAHGYRADGERAG